MTLLALMLAILCVFDGLYNLPGLHLSLLGFFLLELSFGSFTNFELKHSRARRVATINPSLDLALLLSFLSRPYQLVAGVK